MIFRTPLILFLVPIVAALVFLIRRRQGIPSIRFPSSELFFSAGRNWRTRLHNLPFYLRILSIVLFLIALARQLAGVRRPDQLAAHMPDVEREIDAILDRAGLIDVEEVEEARSEIEEWLRFWRSYSPPEYGRMGGTVSDQTLVFPYGAVPDQQFQREAWPLLTSMRNVDGTAAGRVLNVYEAPPAEGVE